MVPSSDPMFPVRGSLRLPTERALREVVGDDTVGFEIPFSGSFSATID